MTSSAPAVLSSPARVTLTTNRPENIAIGADAAVFRRLPTCRAADIAYLRAQQTRARGREYAAFPHF